jgi:hypothetical protein
MSALGQKQTSGHVHVMSALPPKADIVRHDRDVRFAPESGHGLQRQSIRSMTVRSPVVASVALSIVGKDHGPRGVGSWANYCGAGILGE